MAVPKKRTSKTRKNLRKSQWKAKASIEAKKALSKAKMVLSSLSTEIPEVESSN
jgi:large subunit ribosomal protein L32